MSCALPRPEPDAVAERQALRTHLFVTATLCSADGSVPARVRNLSPNGAQIEAAQLPAPGTRVVLKRGPLQASGRIVWQSGPKAGIAFESVASVADWMARHGGAHQDEVDELVAALRSSTVDAANDDVRSPVTRRKMIESELSSLRAELTQLGELLTADVILVATHPEIQFLDISLQRVERLMRHVEEGPVGPAPPSR